MAISSEALVAHVWRRLGFGPAPGDVEAGVAAGGAPAVIDDLLSRPTTSLTDWQWPADGSDYADNIYRFINHMFELWAHSPGAVQERVSWILTGLLPAGFTDVVGYAELKEHQNRLRSWPAASSYKALLTDVAASGTMQKYLNGIFSIPPHANENLARELMELFSLGVTNPLTGADNYSETDVKEVARALTGYRWNHQPGPGGVWFEPSCWDAGNKTFLGADRGAAQLAEVMDAIAGHDSFKFFVPNRVYRELVGFDPSASTLSTLADAWGANGDLGGLVNRIARLPEFVDDATVGNRVKSPVELIVSLIRVLGFAEVDQFSLNYVSDTMRQHPLAPPNVSGWSGPWLHPTHLMLWSKFAYWLTWSDVGPTPTSTQAPTPESAQSPTLRRLFAEATTATATDMALRFAGLYDVSPSTRSAVDAFVNGGTWDWYRACGTMQLIFDSPEFLVS